MHLKGIALIALFASGLGAWHLLAQEPTKKKDERLKSFMQQKLDHSKTILEGLALEDFEKIAKSSQALGLLSLESGWSGLTTEAYLQHSKDFRRTLSNITKAAHEKSLDKAALGYVDLTIRCVECHKYLREVRTDSQAPGK
jgi:hypothetical protein